MLETANQMHRRLLGVIAKSRFETLARPYAWQPMPDSSIGCSCYRTRGGWK